MKKYLDRGYAVDYGRIVKAKKIESVLLDYLNYTETRLSGKNILDVGCGSGHIAAYFSESNHVLAADVVNQVSPDVRDKIQYVRIDDNLAPIPGNAYDVVIVNHVLAHIKKKLDFLVEVHRVLKEKGICYLANPNGLFPVEPYYKIPLLHYLPQKIFLSVAGYWGIKKEDVYLVSHPSVKKLAAMAKFKVKDYTIEVINNPRKYFSEYRSPFGITMPDYASMISPTNIYVLEKSG